MIDWIIIRQKIFHFAAVLIQEEMQIDETTIDHVVFRMLVPSQVSYTTE